MRAKNLNWISYLIREQHVLVDESILCHLIRLCRDHVSNSFVESMNLDEEVTKSFDKNNERSETYLLRLQITND